MEPRTTEKIAELGRLYRAIVSPFYLEFEFPIRKGGDGGKLIKPACKE
jgi:hypothetical protein